MKKLKLVCFLWLLFLIGCSYDQYDFKNLKNYEFQLEDEFPTERPFIACYKDQPHQELCYIGSDHSADINSKTFKLIRKTIEEFKPDLLVLEGFETNKGLSPIAMINYVRKNCTPSSSDNFKCGEPLYALHLAHLKNIPFIGGAPDDEEIFTALQEQGHEKDDVFGFYFTGQITQLFDEKQVSEINELPKKFDECLKCTRVDGITLSYPSYQGWLNQKMGRSVELSELNDPNLIAPIANGNQLQQISSKINLIRDQHILKVILDSSKKYQRILVIYGASHYLTQKDVLAQYFGKPTYSHEWKSLDNIENVKQQLARMVDRDQEVRDLFIEDMNDPKTQKLLEEIDRNHIEHLKAILEKYGWITISKFGKEADRQAWLLVQHADQDPDFQIRCLLILEKQWPLHETDRKNYAYLYDRVAPHRGLKQRYGTQAKIEGNKIELLPFEGSLDDLNKRRQEIGLEPIEEYLETLKEVYKN